MKIKTTAKNIYHKPGTVMDITEGLAKHLISKGFASSLEAGQEENAIPETPKAVNTPKPDVPKAVTTKKTK